MLDGARAWYYNIAGATRAKFSIPHKEPSYQLTLGFCKLYALATRVANFHLGTSCVQAINTKSKASMGTKGGKHVRGMKESDKALIPHAYYT